jgi:hypothetical protein
MALDTLTILAELYGSIFLIFFAISITLQPSDAKNILTL